jgi:hypothetical protein
MVKKRKDTVGGSARVKNLSTEKRLEMHHVHPFAIKICKLPTIGQWFQSCTGLDEETKYLPVDSSVDASQHVGQSTHSLWSSMHNIKEFALNMSRHQPNHIRINTFLDEKRSEGDYEPYFALKSIHLSRVNDLSFVKELKVRKHQKANTAYLSLRL